MYNMGGNIPPRHGSICGQRANWIAFYRGGADAALFQIPRGPGDICDACRHGWIHHWREGRAPYHAATEYLNRGGNEATACGGFYSVRSLHFSHLAYFSNRANPPSGLRRIRHGRSTRYVCAPLPCGHTSSLPRPTRPIYRGSRVQSTPPDYHSLTALPFQVSASEPFRSG